MMKNITIILTAMLWLTLTACSEEKVEGPTVQESDLTIPLEANTWTYVSLEAGAVVATIPFADSLAQQNMAQRTDWDVAYAPDGLMRTNGGASGHAQAAIGTSTSDFAATDILSPFSDLTTDLPDCEIW